MTECRYLTPLTTFATGAKPEKVRTIPLLEEGRAALEEINKGKCSDLKISLLIVKKWVSHLMNKISYCISICSKKWAAILPMSNYLIYLNQTANIPGKFPNIIIIKFPDIGFSAVV
jgi:hypothetical protein